MRLDPRSQWALTLYPEAGEAGGRLVTSRRIAVRGRAPNPVRAKREAARRARTKIRRYCAANRLNRLATLTYAGDGCHDEGRLRNDVGLFVKSLRTRLGGVPFPYVWVPEWHPRGHGLHVHVALGQFVDWRLLRDSWGQGIVHIKLIGEARQSRNALAQARTAGRYLAKYAAKDAAADGRGSGRHRYEVAQGFQPGAIVCYAPTAEAAIAVAARYMGSVPTETWFSSSREGWDGPPACWVAWA